MVILRKLDLRDMSEPRKTLSGIKRVNYKFGWKCNIYITYESGEEYTMYGLGYKRCNEEHKFFTDLMIQDMKRDLLPNK